MSKDKETKAAAPKAEATPKGPTETNTASMASGRTRALELYGKDMSVPDDINSAFRATVNTGKSGSVELDKIAEVVGQNPDIDGLAERFKAIMDKPVRPAGMVGVPGYRANTGQIVMSIRNMLRAAYKRGEKVKIGTAVLHDKAAAEAHKKAAEEKAAKNAARLADLKAKKAAEGDTGKVGKATKAAK